MDGQEAQPLRANQTDQRAVLTTSCRVYDRWLLMARGRITVEPGIAKCEFLPLLGIKSRRRAVVHREREITVYRARIPILLMRTTIRLRDDDRRPVYVWPFGQLRRMTDALEAAGFVVREHTTLLIAAGRPWSRW